MKFYEKKIGLIASIITIVNVITAFISQEDILVVNTPTVIQSSFLIRVFIFFIAEYLIAICFATLFNLIDNNDSIFKLLFEIILFATSVYTSIFNIKWLIIPTTIGSYLFWAFMTNIIFTYIVHKLNNDIDPDLKAVQYFIMHSICFIIVFLILSHDGFFNTI